VWVFEEVLVALFCAQWEGWGCGSGGDEREEEEGEEGVHVWYEGVV